ncbi:uncharacterized protein LOC112560422 [Pomacea canaliculata]|uniref:uncharacterized protein LOC112560422 n=1 Tax=Pomacea canaliculata TaxID=400727 RepID=UPI000D739E57|nr:uncharacterized protein LOC112560422 [Pomacea canaliculata]
MELLDGLEFPMYLLLLLIAVVLFYLYGTWSFGIWKSMGVDGPKPLPFFGNLWELNKKGNEKSIRQWSQTYGRTFGIYCGRQPLLVTTDLDILKEVLVKDFNRFSDRFDKFELLPKEIRANLFAIGGADWKRVRTLLTPTFSSGKLKLMENYIDRCSNELAENLEEAIRKGERIETKKYFGAYTLDVISSTAFGIQVNSQKDLNDPFVKDVASVMHEATSSNGLLTVLAASVQALVPFIRLLAIHLFPLTRWNSFLRNINRIIEERKRERTRNAQTDFLQMILNYEETEGSKNEQIKSLSRTEVIAQAFVFFVAGYDTTSTALQFLAYNLACCPEAQEKVVQEIKNQIGDDKPTYEGLAKLKYLESVVMETLRMIPPVNTVNRMASEEVTIKGVTIPKGAGVCVPIANVMRDPEYFPDPDEFKPDRFVESADGVVNPFSNLVFGFGPRQCIGMRLALLQIKMAMVHVLRKVRFIKTDDLKNNSVFKERKISIFTDMPIESHAPVCFIFRKQLEKTRSYIRLHLRKCGQLLTNFRRQTVLNSGVMELLDGLEFPMYLLLLLIAVVLFYLYGTWSFGIWKSLGIDGPKPLPFVGNQWELNKKGNENSIRKWSQTYGRTFGIYSGRQPLLVTTDLDILKEVLVKDFSRFTDRFDKFELLPKEIQANLFVIGGADWKRVRTLLTPTFSSGKLKLMENYIDRCSMELTENLEEAIRKGERIDTKKYFGAYTLDVISSTAFGIQMNSQKDLNDPFVKDVASVMEEATSSSGLLTILAASVQSLVPLLRLLAIHLFPLTRWNSLLGNINRIIEERKQKRTNARTDFLQMILNYEETEGSKKEQIKSLSRTEVIAQVFVFFADGYDTTSIAIQFLAYNLACCPEVQEKVVQEIKSQIGDDKPTYESLAKLSYLDSVLQETLRMFPPVNIVNRMASEEVTIKGVTIPKGAGVVVPIANVMRDPEYFPDPDEFKPDRFIESADGVVNPFSNLAFGFGPRQCIGMRLALLEIKMAMVHVLRKIRFIKTDDLKETPAIRPGSFMSIPERPLLITAVLREAATKTRMQH